MTKTHGHYGTVEYMTWIRMISRCENDKQEIYKNYGGRGIRVCRRWRSGFEFFLSDMGPRPSAKHSLDRIDNDGGYWCGKCAECVSLGRPSNCRWATMKEQGRNRRGNAIVVAHGVARTLAEWAETTGISRDTIKTRIRQLGWSPEKAIVKGGLVLRGEAHGRAKITDGMVLEIRALAKSGVSQREIGARFGVHQTHISRLMRGESWSHV